MSKGTEPPRRKPESTGPPEDVEGRASASAGRGTTDPAETRPQPEPTGPEPVEGQDQAASTDSAPGEPINAESDANARVKGAEPEGESEPDAGTKPETLTGPSPTIRSDDDEATTGGAEIVAPEPSPEVLASRKGMFGVIGTGDTSGFGGLTRTVEFPAAATPPFGGWWDSVYDRIGRLFAEGDDPLGPPARDSFAEGDDPLGPPGRDSFAEGDDPLEPPGRDLVPSYSDVITKVVIHRGEITFHVARERLAELVRHLRDDAYLRFEFCSSVSGVHYPADTGRELHAVYHLQSMTHNRRIRLEVSAPDDDPHIPSVVSTYPTADWHERETYDMFGIVFDGHPALTRILMPDDWPGHPQRKDYPLGGIPVEYKGATVPPPEERRAYS
jgi:NADH-quinone oxidoreductase subunit C